MQRILYIEDDFSNRQLVEFILERRDDLQVIGAENGTEGLRLAEAENPDIILLDLSLPDFSGFEVLQKLRQLEAIKTTPIIAVSGDSSPEDIEKGRAAGFHDYLTKPIIVAKLNSVLDRTIASLSR